MAIEGFEWDAPATEANIAAFGFAGAGADDLAKAAFPKSLLPRNLAKESAAPFRFRQRFPRAGSIRARRRTVSERLRACGTLG
jgi:hypothetical protein